MNLSYSAFVQVNLGSVRIWKMHYNGSRFDYEWPSGSGLASFLPVLVEECKASCQGKSQLRMSPGEYCEVTCHGELYKRRAKNAASCASAGSPCDFVLDAGFVRVPQDFINGNKIKTIDFGVDYQTARAAEGH